MIILADIKDCKLNGGITLHVDGTSMEKSLVFASGAMTSEDPDWENQLNIASRIASIVNSQNWLKIETAPKSYKLADGTDSFSGPKILLCNKHGEVVVGWWDKSWQPIGNKDGRWIYGSVGAQCCCGDCFCPADEILEFEPIAWRDLPEPARNEDELL